MNTGLWVAKIRCVVPKVRGLPLADARAALARADCRTGRVARDKQGTQVAAVCSHRGRGREAELPVHVVRLVVGA